MPLDKCRMIELVFSYLSPVRLHRYEKDVYCMFYVVVAQLNEQMALLNWLGTINSQQDGLMCEIFCVFSSFICQ